MLVIVVFNLDVGERRSLRLEAGSQFGQITRAGRCQGQGVGLVGLRLINKIYFNAHAQVRDVDLPRSLAMPMLGRRPCF